MPSLVKVLTQVLCMSYSLQLYWLSFDERDPLPNSINQSTMGRSLFLLGLKCHTVPYKYHGLQATEKKENRRITYVYMHKYTYISLHNADKESTVSDRLRLASAVSIVLFISAA